MTERDALLTEVDNYTDTLKGVLALVHWLTWDGAAKRSMADVEHLHGSPQTYDASQGPVTPDFALRQGKTFGVLGEAKISFGGKQDKESIREQITKYDRVAALWMASGLVADCSTILLTHGSRKTQATDYFKAETDAGRFVPSGKFAVVGFMRSNQRNAFLFIEKASGDIAPSERNAALRDGVNVRLEYLDQHYGGVKFYDAAPPLCYLLEVIWDHALPSMIPEDAYTRDAAGRRRVVGSKVPVEVEVTALATRLRDAFSMRLLNSNLPESPRVGLVRSVMEKLVKWGLATRKGDHFLVGWKKLRPGALEYFCERTVKDAATIAKARPRVGGKRRRSGGGDRSQTSLFES